MTSPIKTKLWLSIGLNNEARFGERPYQKEAEQRMLPRIPDNTVKPDFFNLRRKYQMHEDDMTFMKEVFMPDDQGNTKPKLPFNQYIVKWGYHPLTLEAMQKHEADQEPRSAMSDMRRKYGDHYQVEYSIPRPDGTATKVSVISGIMFYSREKEPYEVMVYDTASTYDDPLPYQTDEQLMLLIAKLLAEN